MKVSSTTSAKATGLARPTGRSSDRRLSPITADFALSGPSEHPDPAIHAYRKDLADIALAGRVIASHYALPLERMVAGAATLRAQPNDESPAIAELAPGAPFEMLDNSLGWAWGYGGADRLVGYVRSDAVAAPAS